MNIKEHIDQEHYPIRDTAGRPVLKTVSGRTVVICATDGPDGHELVGWYSGDSGEGEKVSSWRANGCWSGPDLMDLDLLPPPPPTFTERAWAVVGANGIGHYGLYWSRDNANCAVHDGHNRVVIELTGQREGVWP